MTSTDRPGRRYAARLAAIMVPCTLLALIADRYLPHPLAVLALIGSLTAIVAAPFLTPIDPPEEDP